MDERWMALLLSVVSFGLLAAITHDHVFWAGNDASRFAQIEALAERGEAHIDGSRYAWTPDRVILDGRAFSNKPPLLGILGAGVYRVLRGTFGLSFGEREAEAVYFVTLVLVGGSTAALVAAFYLALGSWPAIRPAVRLLATSALAGGTILTSFSGTLNSHTVAAALLFGSLFAAARGRGFGAGALISLTVCVDIVTGLLFVPAAASLVYDASGRAGLRRYLMASSAGALLFFAANQATVGHPLPPKLVPGADDLSTRFSPSLAGVVLPTTWRYPLECLLGWHGFFSVSPVLLFGAAGMFVAVRRGLFAGRRSALLLSAGVAASILFHVLLAGSFGGWSYGFRYLIPLVPILLFFLPVVLRGPALALFVPVLALSTGLALLGAYHPWPPVDEQDPGAPWTPVALVTNPVGGNLAAWLAEHRPESVATEWVGARFISPLPEERHRYLAIFFGSRGDPRVRLEREGRSPQP